MVMKDLRRTFLANRKHINVSWEKSFDLPEYHGSITCANHPSQLMLPRVSCAIQTDLIKTNASICTNYSLTKAHADATV